MLNKLVLDNGTTILVNEAAHAKSISCYGYFPYGVATEPLGKQGITHLLEHLVFSSSRQYPTPLELAQAFEEIGVDFEAATSRDMVMCGIQSPIPSFRRGFELLMEVLLDASFTQKQLSNEQSVIEEELTYYEEDPEFMISSRVSQTLWGIDHPLGRHVGGRVEDLLQLSYEDVRRHYHEHFVPEALVLVITGPITAPELSSLFQSFMITYPARQGGPVPSTVRYPVQFQPYAEYALASDTIWCGLGFAYPEGAIDRIKMDVMITLLTEGNASILQQSLREEQGLLYHLFSNDNTSRFGGEYQVLFGTQPDHFEKALSSIQTEIAKVKDMSQRSLDVAKARYLAKLSFREESMKMYGRFVGRTYMVHNQLLDMNQFAQGVRSIELSEFRSYAEQLFDPFKCVVVRTGKL